MGVDIYSEMYESEIQKKLETLNRDMGKRLAEYRKASGKTQTEMGKVLGMSRNYYGAIERGGHGLSLSKLIKLDEETDIDIYYLLTGKKRKDHSYQEFLKKCPAGKRESFEEIIDTLLDMVKEP